jgi:hypothetical protein
MIFGVRIAGPALSNSWNSNDRLNRQQYEGTFSAKLQRRHNDSFWPQLLTPEESSQAWTGAAWDRQVTITNVDLVRSTHSAMDPDKCPEKQACNTD